MRNTQSKLTLYRIIFIASLIFIIIWLRLTPAGLLGKADGIGYAICHRIDSHSFHIGERQLPLCARCTGEFLAVFITIAYWVFTKKRFQSLSLSVIGVLIIGTILFTIDGVNSFLHLFPEWQGMWLYQPQNWIRLLTGSYFGVGLGTVIVMLINKMAWVPELQEDKLLLERSFGKLLFLVIIADGLVLMNNPIILLPMALFSVIGVWMALALVYSLFWLIIAKKENSFKNYKELVHILYIGAVTGLVQIAIIDLVRYLSTGTWGGFYLG